ncbi:deoxyhypusine synthase [Edhazardia aedis USNM 41457]|uniref:deoxyhypusine synthase n=1 Tax=Edhazardia aedis (strain USNM 41457) TaxID=1003232 RepID=J9DIL5_EDHAE|nr:deoxyhypusine synthase [Edhazardia aedis USNM 41457]|eukprot:EJW01207.1 deoxyhypusine synthase [Edhazardia aedis USNM 41457]
MQEKTPQSVKELADKTKSNVTFDKPVKGHKFDKKYTLKEFVSHYASVGFQASNLCAAINEINKMLGKSDCQLKIYEPEFSFMCESDSEDVDGYDKISPREIKERAKIYLGCTSNLITSGLRDTICFLAKNKMIDVFVTTAGGIEEDLIKCMKDTYLASFDIPGKLLRKNGYNRVGNLVIPNDNYCDFERWLTNILDYIVLNHTECAKNFSFSCCGNNNNNSKCENIILSVSELIKIFGHKINDESSILYWCAKNQIPVFCPAITDGSIGDIFTFYSNRNRIKLDTIKDIHEINFSTIGAPKTGAIILGSGVIKHHILNANLFRNGADYCVLLNNASEFDGSDAGATINEAVSWGKSRGSGVKLFGDATILFPLIVAMTFADQEF